MGFLNKIFIIITFNLIACKNQIQEPIVLPSISMESTISVPKDTTNKEVEVLKVVKIPDEKNKIIDSVLIFGSMNKEYNLKLIDSIIVHFKSIYAKNIYTKPISDLFENEAPFMRFQAKQNCFAHFNNDNFIDIFFPNIGGGSGGHLYNFFLFDPTKNTFKYQPLLSHHPNVCYTKKSNQYISIGKSGPDRLAIRFEIRNNSIYELDRLNIDFLKGGTTKYDTTMFKYTYKKPNKKVRLEVCYFFTEIKSEKEIKKCSKFIQNIENRIWEDWQLL